MATKIVERYKIFKESRTQQEIFIQEQVGNDFQLQDLKPQNRASKVSIEDDLALEDIEELPPDKDQSNPKAELSEARNELQVSREPQPSQTQETENHNLTVAAEVHLEHSDSESRNNVAQNAMKKVQHLPRDNKNPDEDLDGIETLSEEVINVQDSIENESNFKQDMETNDEITPERSLPTPKPFLNPPQIKINNLAANPEVNTIAAGAIIFVLGVFLNVPLWILFFYSETFSNLFLFIQLNFVPYFSIAILPQLVQLSMNKRMRMFFKEMLTDMFE